MTITGLTFLQIYKVKALLVLLLAISAVAIRVYSSGLL